MTSDPQDVVCERLAARLVVPGRVEPDAAADVLDALGLLPGQAIGAPARLSTGFFDPSSGGLSARTALGRAS